MEKPARTGEQLRAMVQLRVDALPEVQRRRADGRATPVVGPPARQPRDRLGHNWDMAAPQHNTGLLASFREIVDALRDAYDLV
jgi:hypothetical protein